LDLQFSFSSHRSPLHEHQPNPKQSNHRSKAFTHTPPIHGSRLLLALPSSRSLHHPELPIASGSCAPSMSGGRTCYRPGRRSNLRKIIRPKAIAPSFYGPSRKKRRRFHRLRQASIPKLTALRDPGSFLLMDRIGTSRLPANLPGLRHASRTETLSRSTSVRPIVFHYSWKRTRIWPSPSISRAAARFRSSSKMTHRWAHPTWAFCSPIPM